VKTAGRVPWAKVHDYLLHVESCATPREFMLAASVEVEKLIPFDAAAGVFSTLDVRILQGIGLTESVNASYNTYYRTRQPAFLPGHSRLQDHWDFLFGPTVNWRNYRNQEFAQDFMIPNGLCKSLSRVPSGPICLSINRSRFARDFTEADVAILDVLHQHLGNLYTLLLRKGALTDPALSTERIGDQFHSLSRREAEICSLLARRFNTSEIADYLFISRRTVERHIENIFDKLHVQSRGQLRMTLGSETGTESRTGHGARPT
jgi:DNA-binding CsgD family transcriptional regulator